MITVFVDGENFRQRLTEILEDLGLVKSGASYSYDVAGLIKDVLGRDDAEILYYASEIKTPVGYTPSIPIKRRITKIKANMRRWVADLSNQGVKYIKAGNLKVKEGRPCTKCHAKQEHLQEKGVDVRLALDVFEWSLDETNREIIVVSSDTDICPVYHKIKKRNAGISIKYLCFATSVNRAVSAATDETITIPTAKVQKFLKKS